MVAPAFRVKTGGAHGRDDTLNNRRRRRAHLQGRRVTRGRVPIPDTDGPPVSSLYGQCACRLCVGGNRPMAGVVVGEDGNWPKPHLKLAADRLDGHLVARGPVYWLSYDCWVTRQGREHRASWLWSDREDKAHERGALYVPPAGAAGATQDDVAPPEAHDPTLAETTLVGAAERGYVAEWQVLARDARDEAETRRAHAIAKAEGWREMPDGRWVRP